MNIVVPAAERLRTRLLADGDERAGELTVLLDPVRNGASAGWASGEGAAMQLVRCITQWSNELNRPIPEADGAVMPAPGTPARRTSTTSSRGSRNAGS